MGIFKISEKMYKSTVAITVLSALFSQSEGRMSKGKCEENISYMTEFDAADYSGKWYEIVRDKENPYTVMTDCVTKEFGPVNKKDGTMELYFRGYYHNYDGYYGVNGKLYQCGEGT